MNLFLFLIASLSVGAEAFMVVQIPLFYDVTHFVIEISSSPHFLGRCINLGCSLFSENLTMSSLYKRLAKTAIKNDVSRFARILSEHKQLSQNESTWMSQGGDDTILHVAIRHGALDIMKYAVEEYQLPVDYRNHDRKTLLHEASQFSQQECVSYLLSKGADVNALKKADWTPLMLACTKANPSIVILLLQSGGDPLIRNKDGWNSFHLACRVGNEKIIQTVSEFASRRSSKAELLTTRSKNGRSPLHIAALHGHVDAVDYILSENLTSVDIEDNCGTTPLMDGCCSGSVDLVSLLIERYGADAKRTNKNGDSPLSLATEVGSDTVVRYLNGLLHKENVS